MEGPKYSEPQIIKKEMIDALAANLKHLILSICQEEILLTEAFHHRFPDLPQVACFDTAFHHDHAARRPVIAYPTPL